MYKLEGLAPTMVFRDKHKTIAFYNEVMGFQLKDDHENYLIFVKDDICIHFSEFKELNPNQNTSASYLYVKDIESLFEHCKAKGYTYPNQKLEVQFYGIKEFYLLDPDKNLLRIRGNI